MHGRSIGTVERRMPRHRELSEKAKRILDDLITGVSHKGTFGVFGLEFTVRDGELVEVRERREHKHI